MVTKNLWIKKMKKIVEIFFYFMNYIIKSANSQIIITAKNRLCFLAKAVYLTERKSHIFPDLVKIGNYIFLLQTIDVYVQNNADFQPYYPCRGISPAFNFTAICRTYPDKLCQLGLCQPAFFARITHHHTKCFSALHFSAPP